MESTRKLQSFILEHENWDNWDDAQALSMFCNGVDLAKAADCICLKDKFDTSKLSEYMIGILDYRAVMRLNLLIDNLKRL